MGIADVAQSRQITRRSFAAPAGMMCES